MSFYLILIPFYSDARALGQADRIMYMKVIRLHDDDDTVGAWCRIASVLPEPRETC